MGLRIRIIILTCLMLITTTIVIGIVAFRAQENALLHGIDARLEATARLAREILPADYHDKISGAASVSEAEYVRIVDRWNRLCRQMGLEYIWSLLLIDGKTVFTSGSSTSKDVRKGDHAKFFETHSNPELYAVAFATMKPQYQINDDKWGRIKVVLLPFKDSRGRPFLFGASMKTTEVDALMRKTIMQSMEISAGILFLGVIMSVLLAGTLVRPLEKVTDLARSITNGNWGQVVKTSGASEIQSLAHSVNEMSRSIQETISERKQAEEALLEREERYRTLFSRANDGIFIMTVEGTLVEVNESFARMHGYSTQEMQSKNLKDFDTPETSKLQAERMRQLFAGGALTFEVEHYHRDGHAFPLEVSASMISSGGESYIQCLHRDISERKKIEEGTRELLLMLDSVPNSIVIHDEDGNFLYANQRASELHGYHRAEFMALNLHLITVPASEKHIGARMQELFDRGEISFEIEHLKKNGTILPLWINTKKATWGGKSVFLSVQTDLAERKRAEVEKTKLEAQLFQSQKMQAIGTLAGGIAHDFNNILAGIIGYTEMALLGGQKENQLRYLQETMKGATRAKNLVKQILSFSRQDDHEKSPLDIKILLEEAIKFLRSSIPTTIEINQQMTGEECNIMADPTQMHQIIMNLCTNAAHAMKEAGGTLKIELANIELAKDEIPNHPNLQPGHYVKLTVGDTGHGIDPALIQSIFDPFFTTKSVDEGTGLGLSVVYGIVKSHGGVITVYSEQGKGAAFNVYLPRITYSETMKGDIDKPIIGGTERILFVDDEPALVDIAKGTLSSLGYDVTGVLSSVEALDIVSAEPQRFDLVITDMALPRMTGIDLSRKLLQIRPNIPIILCSGIKDHDTEAQSKSLGIRAYLTKPLTRKDLSHAIRNTLDGHKKHDL